MIAASRKLYVPAPRSPKLRCHTSSSPSRAALSEHCTAVCCLGSCLPHAQVLVVVRCATSLSSLSYHMALSNHTTLSVIPHVRTLVQTRYRRKPPRPPRGDPHRCPPASYCRFCCLIFPTRTSTSTTIMTMQCHLSDETVHYHNYAL